MSIVKVSSKYRIEIPRELRAKHHIKKGQNVSLISVGGIIEIVPDYNIADMEGIFPKLTLDGIRDEGDRVD